MDVRLACACPLTGPSAHLGKDLENGARLAVDQANAGNSTLAGEPVKFVLVSEDDASDPRMATTVAQKLVDTRVHGVIGHLNSGCAIPASKIYFDAGIVQITAAATNPKLTQQSFDTVFRTVTTDEYIGRALARYAIGTLGARTIAVIDDRTAYGQGLASSFAGAARAAGATIVATDFTTDKATDFNAILTSIKTKNPHLVFLGGMDSIGGPMLRQMKQLGLRAPLMGGDGLGTAELPKLAADGLTDGAVYATTPGVAGPQDAPIRGTYLKKFNASMLQYAPYAYDAVNAMIAVMTQAGSADPRRYLPRLAALTHNGVTGTISFDSGLDLQRNRIAR